MHALPPDDFRRLRWVLDDEDFALVTKGKEPPLDRIDRETWRSISGLPDDVAVRTSDFHGCVLRQAWSLWEEWSCLIGAIPDDAEGFALGPPIKGTAITASDEFQSSTYNVLVGFYRNATSSLRNALEHMAIGARFELAGDSDLFEKWLVSEFSPRLGWATDGLRRYPRVASLEQTVHEATGRDLFGQRRPGVREEGIIRRLFSDLSGHAHGNPPRLTDFETWQSNGPIYSTTGFDRWQQLFHRTFAVALLLAKIARPDIKRLRLDSTLTIGQCFEQALVPLSNSEPILDVLHAIPAAWWD